MEVIRFPDGMTVKQLKEFIKDWPEMSDGHPTMVLMKTDNGFTAPVIAIEPTGMSQQEDRTWAADMVFESSNF